MNIDLRKRKTVFNLPTPTLLFSHIKEPFRWCCEYGTFLQKNNLHDKNRTFSTRVFSCRFFSSRFSEPFKDFNDSTPKITVPV